MTNSLNVSRVQKRGQVTIPLDIRLKMGLEEGDLVAFVETSQGVLIRPQEVELPHTSNLTESTLKELQQVADVGPSDLFAFADGLANDSPNDERVITTAKEGKSVIVQTAGIFARPGRDPIDFGSARQEFMEESVRRVTSKMSRKGE